MSQKYQTSPALVPEYAWYATSPPAYGVTVTLNVFVVELPFQSVAFAVTVVVPTGNVLPDGRLTVTTGAGSLSSVAVTLNRTPAPKITVAAVVMFAGTVSVGAVVSLP